MYNVQSNQRHFDNFAEVLQFLFLLNDDVDTSKPAPEYALFSKSTGIVSGVNFINLCQRIHDVFGIRVVPSGCVQYPNGYLLTFEEGYLEQVKPEEKKELAKESKANLLAKGKELGLEVSNAMKKDEIISVILSSM